MVFSLISRLISWYMDMFWRAVETVKNTVTAFLTFVIILLVLLWMAIFLYGSFYYNYIPAESHFEKMSTFNSGRSSTCNLLSFIKCTTVVTEECALFSALTRRREDWRVFLKQICPLLQTTDNR